MLFANITIAKRLVLGFAIMLIMISIVGGVGLWSLGQTSGILAHTIDVDWHKAEASGTFRGAPRSIAINLSQLLEAHDAGQKGRFNRVLEDIAAAQSQIVKAMEELQRLSSGKDEKALVEKVKEVSGEYLANSNSVITLLKSDQRDDAANALSGDLLTTLDTLQNNVDELDAYEKKSVQTGGDRAKQSFINGRQLLLGIGALAIVFAILYGARLTRTISAAVGRLLDATENLRAGEGDLTFRLPAMGGEFTKLADSLNGFIKKLHDIMVRVSNASGLVNRGAQQISAGNTELSARTEEQASTLEETSASVEELAAAMRRNNDNAKRASQVAKEATDLTHQGAVMVGQVIDTINEISSRSKKVAEIIGLIESIAFQTNILALNAAVEAARAGEQGRGFTVVASEVRMLAQRTATSAKEIGSLINDTVKKIDQGSTLVKQSGTAMEKIVQSIGQVSDLMREVVEASQEQSVGIGQVNQAVVQLDSVVQQNAALVEQAATAADAMKTQAQELDKLVGGFKLAGMHAGINEHAAHRSRSDSSRTAATASRPGQATDDWSEF